MNQNLHSITTYGATPDSNTCQPLQVRREMDDEVSIKCTGERGWVENCCGSCRAKPQNSDFNLHPPPIGSFQAQQHPHLAEPDVNYDHNSSSKVNITRDLIFAKTSLASTNRHQHHQYLIRDIPVQHSSYLNWSHTPPVYTERKAS